MDQVISNIHLGRIADSLTQWEGSIADYLELTPADVSGIKTKYPSDLHLQAREALRTWTQRKGSAATYRNLTQVFKDTGHQGYADNVQRICTGSTSPGTASGGGPSTTATSRQASLPLTRKIKTSDLRMIKWTNEQGQTQRYYPIEKMEGKWRDIGEQIGLEFSQLKSISEEHQKNAASCFRDVLTKWFDNPPSNYPTTWGGLLELLEDCRLTEIVTDLKDALAKANVS